MDVFSHKVVGCGAGGLIGGHMVKQLLHDGVNVIRTVDIKLRNEWRQVHLGVEDVTFGLKLKSTRGVNGRNSDKALIQARPGWEPSTLLRDGLRKTYGWIESQSEALACV